MTGDNNASDASPGGRHGFCAGGIVPLSIGVLWGLAWWSGVAPGEVIDGRGEPHQISRSLPDGLAMSEALKGPFGSYAADGQFHFRPLATDPRGESRWDPTDTGEPRSDSPRCEAAPSYRPPGRRLGARLRDFFAPPEGRHRGLGQPLVSQSWRYRPFSAGWCMGIVQGSPLVDDWVGGKQGFFGGYRLGWDYDHYWGCEMRFCFGNVALYDSSRAKDAQRALDDANGLGPDDPFRKRFDGRRDATFCLWDVDLLYYPWGDAAWRPYLMGGLGTARVKFIDRLSKRYDETVFGLPIAIGVKYRYNDWMAWRLELADNIAFGDSFNMVHHLSLTAGAEVRFGGRRVAYWPWKPGRHYW